MIVKWDHLPLFKLQRIQLFSIALKLAGHPFDLGNLTKSTELDKKYIYMKYNRLTKTGFHIRYLLPGTAYELRIAAVNEEGMGPLSSPVTFTTKK